jgi:PAS domain S-box-containing protein
METSHANSVDVKIEPLESCKTPSGNRATAGATADAHRPEHDKCVTQVLPGKKDFLRQRATQEALRLSEIRYRRLFQTAQDGILILDAKTGEIIDANAFMSRLLGQELNELLGKELWEIGLFGDIAANKAAFEELKANGYCRYEHLPVQNRDGKTTQVEFVSNVYREGRRMVAQCNVRDITARVELEQRIKQQTADLADQSRRKDEFLAVLSHELRNPLAPICSAIPLLSPPEGSSETSIQKQARAIIERQVAQLTRLISDLLQVSRVATGQIRLQREVIDMNQIVGHALQTADPLIERRRHEVSMTLPTEPVWVDADATRLEEVVVNLLGNASKFTDEGGRIFVSVELREDQVLLRVRDSGIGIEPEILPHIFDLFTQADRSLDRSQGGLGIGLSLVRRLVELHGGAVEAHSAGVGQGSEFIVCLPSASAPVAQETIPVEQHKTTGRGRRVLVVDDNVDACRMLSIVLQLQGHTVQAAFTGRAAVETATHWLPDVVLLDIGLPEIDGYEVCRRLRRDPALRNTKLIALTGYGAGSDIASAREAGFDAHVLKPIDHADFDRLLSGWNA